MKLLKKTFLVLLSLILFTAITLWILAKNINPETTKQLISNQISALTHKKSHIDGAISWQLFPRPGLKFSQIHIGDKQLNEDYSLLIDSMSLNLKITPLLKGTFVFSEITIDGLNMLINQDAVSGIKYSEKSIPKGLDATNTSSQFAIQKLLLNHGQITINKQKQQTVFKNIQIGMEQFNLRHTPFPIQIKAKFTQADPSPTTKASISFKGRLKLSPTLIDDFKKELVKSSVEGELLIQNTVLNQFVIKKIRATLKTNKEHLIFNPLTASLYHGESIGDMNYAINTHQLTLNQTATNLDGKQFMTALFGQDMISGNLDYSIHAMIPIEHPGLENITSNGNLTFKEGELFHINTDKVIANLKTKLNTLINGIPLDFNKTTLTNTADTNQYNQGNTAFKLTSVQYQLQNNKISSDSLLIQTDNLHIKGEGNINLVNHEMNSRLHATINNNNDLLIQKVQQLLGGYFPIIISGTMEQPLVAPDLKYINPRLTPLLIKSTLSKPFQLITDPLKGLMQ